MGSPSSFIIVIIMGLLLAFAWELGWKSVTAHIHICSHPPLSVSLSLSLTLSISLSVWSLDMPLPPFQSACERICCHLCIPAIISRHFLSLNERQWVCESVKRYLWSYRNDSLADSVNVGFISVYVLYVFLHILKVITYLQILVCLILRISNELFI